MKILHIIQRYPPSIGGSETWCQGMARYCAARGHEVEVLTINVNTESEYWKKAEGPNSSPDRCKIDFDKGVKVIRCKITRPGRLFLPFLWAIHKMFGIFYMPHSIEMYSKMAREIKGADIVHLHTLPYPHNLAGCLVAKLFRKKIVITPHFHMHNALFERGINYLLLKMCDAVFAVSIYEKEHFIKKGLKKEKIFLVFNSLDPEDYKPEDPERFRERFFKKHGIEKNSKLILFIGRKIEYKGIADLIEAARTLRKDLPLKLLLIGPDFPWFREFYSRLPEEDKKQILDLGVVSHEEKVNILHLCDLLVLPSRFEAFGIVFLEAWACHAPVVGSDVGPLPSVIDQGGLIFRCGDIDDLKEKIQTILASPSLAKEMAREGREKLFRYYTRERSGGAILDVYFNLLKCGS